MISKIIFLGTVMKKKWYFILFLSIVMFSVDAQSSGGYGFCPRERYITLATGPTLEYVEQGRLRLGDMVQVTKEAARMGGSQVYLDSKEQFSVEDLLYALMVLSANDAAVALATHVAGS